MLAQSFPLMLVLFFLFPRIGPLWTMPLKSTAAQTGMSDRLRPGDVSQLSQSDEVAFRVRFDGAIPPQSELYWRGLVMSRLDGDSWRSLRYFEIPATERREVPVARLGETLDYSVLMAPTQQNWLYGLRYARAERGGVMHLPDFRLYSPVEVENELLYRVRSWPGTRLEPELSQWRRRVETELPGNDNPRTRELARSLRGESVSNADFVERALSFFRDGGFRYTLQPPLLAEQNAMDDFVFGARRGFCEHFAYAFTVMMRAADVPARIVAGYLGGEVNPVDRTVLVHQFDAHAWVEVWLAGEGWVRVDPTAVVAPDRIEFGLERAVAAEGSFLANSPFSLVRYRGIGLVNAIRLRYEALTYRWQSWMTGFDGAAQVDFLRGMLGEISVSRSLLLLFGSGALVIGAVSLLLFRGSRADARAPFEEELLRFQETLWRSGLERRPGETPAQLAGRAAGRWPAESAIIASLQQTLSRRIYGPELSVDDRRLLRSVRQQLRTVRKKLRGATTFE
jgi:transglutaminase-like putative cysteine protease